MARILALFEQTLQLSSEERREFVLRSPEAPEVQEEVLFLLEHEGDATEFLSKPAVESFPEVVRHAGGTIAEFQIVRELGRGAMGVVYLADDTSLHRQVALKVLGSHLTGSTIAARRFRREAQAAARLQHPSIVPIYRYGEDRGTQFIAMEYVRGETLDARLATLRSTSTKDSFDPGPASKRKKKSKSVSNKRTADIDYVRQCARTVGIVARGLEYAHNSGVLHRDVKPSNILLDDSGAPRLTDFGIAKLELGEKLSHSGDISGTFRYMSPEQIKGVKVDHRTDIFSMGVVLYEMLTLESPFPGQGIEELAEAIGKKNPAPVRSVNPAVPRDLETICHQALEKQPARRYPTATHLAADLESFLRGQPIMGRRIGLGRKVTQWFKSRRSHSIAAGFILLFASLGVAGGLHLQSRWQSMASVTFQSSPEPPLTVLARRWDHAQLRFGAPQSLGLLPLHQRLMEPGSYRFLVRANSGEFLELDEVLRAGAEIVRTVGLPGSLSAADEMILFPSGDYVIRPVRGKGESDDQSVYVEGFSLDRAKVSNVEYLEFVQASAYPQPAHWELYGYDENLANRPIVGVRLEDAQAYCRWRGKRLPTVVEWEAAARWPDGRLYPWGSADNTPSTALPAYEAFVAASSEDPLQEYQNFASLTADVADDPNAHPQSGLLQLLSNVREITSSVMPYDDSQLITKGAHWANHPQTNDLRSVQTIPIAEHTMTLGFRCARSQSPFDLLPAE